MAQLYALFERKRGAKHWTRVSGVALPKSAAVSAFQSALLQPALEGLSVERSLRPVKTENNRSDAAIFAD